MTAAQAAFVEKMGLAVETDGGSRIAGRIIGFLLLQPEPCSLDDLAAVLQVSKASVSTNARMLEGWGMIEQIGVPGDRRDYYQIADDMQGRMMERKLERLRQLRALFDEALRMTEGEGGVVQRRLHAMHELHTRIVRNIEADLARLRSGEAPAHQTSERERAE